MEGRSDLMAISLLMGKYWLLKIAVIGMVKIRFLKENKR